MSNAILNAAWRAPCRTPAAKLVLVRLADMADEKGVCWPSMERIARDCDIGERTAQRAIGANVESGHVTVTPETGRASRYLIHPRQNDTPATVTPDPRRNDAPPPSFCPKTPAKMTPKPSGTINEPPTNPQPVRLAPSRRPVSLAECQAKGERIGWPEPGPTDWYRDCEECGWTRGDGTPFDNWARQMVIARDTARARGPHGNGNGKPETVWELKQKIEAKQKQIEALRSAHAREDESGTWRWPATAAPQKAECLKLIKEIEAMTKRLAT